MKTRTGHDLEVGNETRALPVAARWLVEHIRQGIIECVVALSCHLPMLYCEKLEHVCEGTC